jgi:outer membrane immunogenic protein
MSKRLIGVVMLAALLIAGQAMAANSSSGSGSFNWNGFYAGLNVGGAWTSDSVTFNNPFGSAQFSASNLDTSGVVGGGQIGYNWQCTWWLLGVEADFQGTSLSKSVEAFDAVTSTAASFESSMPWFGTVRGRAGWLATPCLLIYGTGGFAYGEVENSARFLTTPGPGVLETSSSSVRTGWTAGAGVEYALSKCWTVKVEYLFVDLGSRSFGTPVTNVELDQNTQMVRAGVNFKF